MLLLGRFLTKLPRLEARSSQPVHEEITTLMKIHYTNCPICNSADISIVLSVKDHTVSGESFPVAHCNQCTLRFTQDVPDPVSIGPYYKSENYISHTNTSKGLINGLYQFVRKRTLKGKRKLVQKVSGLSRGRLLDVGSGVGSFANEMQQNGWEVTGLEPDDDARAVAKKEYGLELQPIDRFYHLQPGSFDVITLWHVMEHVHDLQQYVQQLRVLLKDTGKLVIAVPNYTSKDASIYKEYWAAWDVPRHLYHFSPQSMLRLLESNGMKIGQYKPMWYDSFYICLLSSKYKNGKSNLIASFFNGLRSNLKAMGDVKKCSSVIYIVSRF
jgi:2-polyprenyl-3-methyl-5-hydroxy-6-metoxy-1,4-benzoquinol methylase/transcription elongation factor Elf1